MITTIACDLDGTLCHYKNGYSQIFKIFEKYGISETQTKKGYEKILESGFSIEKLSIFLKEKYAVKIHLESVEKEFQSFLKKSLVLYDDVLPFLKENRSLSFVIVSFGDPGFQKQKIELLGLKPEKLIVTHKRNDKGLALHSLHKESHDSLIYIDNHISELDEVRKKIPHEERVKTIFLDRNDQYAGRPSPHLRITSLQEVSTLLRAQSSLE